MSFNKIPLELVEVGMIVCYSQTITNNHKQSQTITNNHKQSQTITNNHKQSQTKT